MLGILRNGNSLKVCSSYTVSYLVKLCLCKLLKNYISSFLKLYTLNIFFCFFFCMAVLNKKFYFCLNLSTDFSIFSSFSFSLLFNLSKYDCSLLSFVMLLSFRIESHRRWLMKDNRKSRDENFLWFDFGWNVLRSMSGNCLFSSPAWW